MAKATTAFLDNTGKLHTSAETAVLSDIAQILGRIGADAGLVLGIAQKILEKRDELEAVFAEYDQLKVADAAELRDAA